MTKTTALKSEPGGSRIARALADSELMLGGTPRVTPIKPGEVTFGRTLLWRVLVEPHIPKYNGLIETPTEVETAERILTTVGRVVQVGDFAFQSKTASGLHLAEETNKPAVGNYVLYSQYAGQEINLRSGNVLRILNDTEILMVIDDPDAIRGYL